MVRNFTSKDEVKVVKMIKVDIRFDTGVFYQSMRPHLTFVLSPVPYNASITEMNESYEEPKHV